MITLTYGSFAQHNAQILTGFNILTKGKCKIASFPDETLPTCVVLADIDGRRIAYDTCDGYFHAGAIGTDERYHALSEKTEILYKRDFNSAVDPKDLLYVGKIKPLGLNYFCYDNRIKKLYYPGFRLIKNFLKEVVGLSYDVNWKRFESDVVTSHYSCDVLFLTRLWNPDAAEVENQKIAEERKRVNSMRISVIHEMRRRYGNSAVCGVVDDSYARRTAPELIISDVTKKASYLKIMKEAKIAVTSLGLHESNGWRTGEYMAAGRSVVMEEPYYEIPFAKKAY